MHLASARSKHKATGVRFLLYCHLQNHITLQKCVKLLPLLIAVKNKLAVIIEMQTEGLIENRNIDLWNSLNAVHEIEIQKEQRDDYLVYSINDKSIIFVPIDNVNSASFTHELLHIYLRTKRVFIGGGLTLSINESPILPKIFSKNLIEHIGNCVDHIKMLPEFINLGYDNDEFLSDSLINKLTTSDIDQIKNRFVVTDLGKTVYNSSVIDLYVGKYFAAIACPSLDYTIQLNELKNIDRNLYKILEEFSNSWIKFDYNDKNPITCGYQLFLYEFIGNLEKWTNGKIIK